MSVTVSTQSIRTSELVKWYNFEQSSEHHLQKTFQKNTRISLSPNMNRSFHDYSPSNTIMITDTEHVIRIVIISTITVLIFTTNGIITTVLCNTNTLTYNIKYLIGSLCLSDMFTGVIFIPTLTSAYKGRWIFGKALCKIVSMAYATVMSVTILTLIVMVIDKYVLIRFPMKYQSIATRKNCAITVITLWLVSIGVIASCDVLLNYQHQYNKSIQMCSIGFTNESDQRRAVIAGSIMGCPLIFVYTFCNVEIYRVCHIQRNRIHIQQIGNVVNRMMPNTKGLKTISIATLCTLGCLVPFIVIRMATWLNMLNPSPFVLFMAYMNAYCTSFTNWFIYTKTHAPYRHAQRKTWMMLKTYILSNLPK